MCFVLWIRRPPIYTRTYSLFPYTTRFRSYDLFKDREDHGLSAFRENGAETLGPREAMGQLQTALRRVGELGPNQKLAYRDQISGLVGHRDNIIHREHEISANDLNRGLDEARGFIERYGRSLLQIDLLQ